MQPIRLSLFAPSALRTQLNTGANRGRSNHANLPRDFTQTEREEKGKSEGISRSVNGWKLGRKRVYSESGLRLRGHLPSLMQHR